MTSVATNYPAINNAQVAQNAVGLPKIKFAEKGLLILTVACAALALIPPLRLAGALALRGVALLSSGINVIDSWKNEGVAGKIAQIAKVAIVVLGIVALALSSPALIIASLVADIAIQTFEFAKAIYNKEPLKALNSLAVIVIDALALASIAAGSWQLMVAAAATSAAFMGVLGIQAVLEWQNKGPSQIIDIICYVALAALGVTSAISTVIVSNRIQHAYFKLKNENRHDSMIVLDKNGRDVAVVAPGRTIEIEVDAKNCFDNKGLKLAYWGEHPNYRNPNLPRHIEAYKIETRNAPLSSYFSRSTNDFFQRAQCTLKKIYTALESFFNNDPIFCDE